MKENPRNVQKIYQQNVRDILPDTIFSHELKHAAGINRDSYSSKIKQNTSLNIISNIVLFLIFIIILIIRITFIQIIDNL